MSAIQKINPYKLYTNIHAICKARGMSIAELERATGLGNGVIRKWDQASPTVRTVMAVADYLGTTVSDLLKAPEKGMSP